MPRGPKGGPVEHLSRKSDAASLQQRLGAAELDIVVIDDLKLDADAVAGMLRVALGGPAGVRHASSLAQGVALIKAKTPSVVFLDDILPPTGRAPTSIEALRRAGYDGPVVVISGEVSRIRRFQILEAGAAEVLHKDDLNSVRLLETLHAVLVPKGSCASAPAPLQS